MQNADTVKRLSEELDALGFEKTRFFMNPGFYSEENISELYQNNTRFLVNASLSLSFVRENFDKICDDVRMPGNYFEEYSTYGCTVTAEWSCKQKRPYKADESKINKRIYIHYYYSTEKGADEEQLFDNHISELYNELSENCPDERHAEEYRKFFEIKETRMTGNEVCCKEDNIKNARRYLGYFALITNEKMDAFTALNLYRTKNIAEKVFGNIEDRLNMRRYLEKSGLSLCGKIFTEFTALTLISCLDHKMKETGLYKEYTMQELLDKLDVIECFEDENHKLRTGKLSSEQKKIYSVSGVPLPSSS